MKDLVGKFGNYQSILSKKEIALQNVVIAI